MSKKAVFPVKYAIIFALGLIFLVGVNLRSGDFLSKEPLINRAITSVFGGQGDHGQIPATVDRFPCYFRGRNGCFVSFQTQFTCQA